MSKLSNKVAVATGASKGIGAGIAKGLAAEDAASWSIRPPAKRDGDRVIEEIGGPVARRSRFRATSANHPTCSVSLQKRREPSAG